ncbi:MAG: hypothetical protein QME68_03530 [Elusimicrobiota bacterium]|nr:hypothetical protein [Elusimicrobiota bacterium]
MKASITTLTNVMSRLSQTVFNSLSLKLVNCKVRDMNKQINMTGENQILRSEDIIFKRELEYEKNRLVDTNNKSFGNIYDGFKFALTCSEIIPKPQQRGGICHILFTNQLIATYDENDRRYHLRSAVFYLPLSVISTTGIVDAPAKPREYYLKKQAGMKEAELQKEFASKCLQADDSRLTEVLKGFVMQAIFYFFAGEPFCKNKLCRLYNAHWQEELIQSQLKKGKPEFCIKHSKMLKTLK